MIEGITGNSDPGTSGLLSPFAKINGLYFDDTPEPCSFYYDIAMELKEKYEAKGYTYVPIEFDNPEDFYKMLVTMNEFADGNIKISGTSRVGTYDLVINSSVDLDDDSAPSIDKDAKKKKKSEKEAIEKQKAEEYAALEKELNASLIEEEEKPKKRTRKKKEE